MTWDNVYSQLRAQAFHPANEERGGEKEEMCTRELLMNLPLKWGRICRLNLSDSETSRWCRLPDAHLHRNFSWKLAKVGLLCWKYRPHICIQDSQSQERIQQIPLGKKNAQFFISRHFKDYVCFVWVNREYEKQKIQCLGIYITGHNSSMKKNKKIIFENLLSRWFEVESNSLLGLKGIVHPKMKMLL